MHAAAVFTGSEQSGNGGFAVGVELDTAHHVVGGGYDLDAASGEIEAAVGAALDHAGKTRGDAFRPQVAHLDIDTAHGRRIAGAHFRIDGPADHVPGGALTGRVVFVHETLAGTVHEPASGAAQALFQHRTGHARIGPGQQSGGVELHHLHVSQTESRAQRHGEPVTTLVPRRRVVKVHGRSATGRQQYRFRLHQAILTAAHVDEQHPRET